MLLTPTVNDIFAIISCFSDILTHDYNFIGFTFSLWDVFTAGLIISLIGFFIGEVLILTWRRR